MIKTKITINKECILELDGFTEDILKELFTIIPTMIATILERLNFPEKVKKEIVRKIIDILEEKFLS